eukprot:10430165-Karenia_brevis.AAC.1
MAATFVSDKVVKTWDLDDVHVNDVDRFTTAIELMQSMQNRSLSALAAVATSIFHQRNIAADTIDFSDGVHEQSAQQRPQWPPPPPPADPR